MKKNIALKLLTSEAAPSKSTNASPERIPLVFADMPPYEELAPAFREIIESRKVSNFGKYNQAFEGEATRLLGVPAVTVSSGTMGLLFALQALGVTSGDRVLVPSFTFMATVQAILYCGAVPIFLEIGPDMTVSVEDLKEQLAKNERVAAVIGVHTYGLPARVEEIQRAVDQKNQDLQRKIKVIYDGAHAFGASVGKKRVGSFGDAEVFSLSVTKALVAIEGGMITSRHPEVIERIRKMRNYGIESNYNTFYPGLNGKMSELHSVVGLHNLKNLDWVLAERKRKAQYYVHAIESVSGFRTISVPSQVVHTYKDFTVFVPQALQGKRDEVCRELNAQGIDNRAYFYPAVHEQEYFKGYHSRPLPVTEDLSRRCITLPFFTSMTEAQMERVAEALSRSEKKLK